MQRTCCTKVNNSVLASGGATGPYKGKCVNCYQTNFFLQIEAAAKTSIIGSLTTQSVTTLLVALKTTRRGRETSVEAGV